MKLEYVRIRDFRSIAKLDLPFKDDLELIRDCVPIVGPNTSGKTTILDAIALCLMPVTELYSIPGGFANQPSCTGSVWCSRGHRFLYCLVQ